MNHLGLFAKFWQPGKVKTRLAAAISDEPASQVYYVFLSHLVMQLRDTGHRRIIGFYPQANVAEFTELSGSDWELTPQRDGDLGVRMQAFFSERFAKEIDDGSASKVVLIGSDCPTIDSDLIEQAFLRLDNQPVVIGPSTDGGYYLIGMREPYPSMFDNIEWSTSAVLKQTLDHLHQQQIGYELLPEMTDIDQFEDFESLCEQLKSSKITADQNLLMSLNEVI